MTARQFADAQCVRFGTCQLLSNFDKGLESDGFARVPEFSYYVIQIGITVAALAYLLVEAGENRDSKRRCRTRRCATAQCLY